MLAPEVIEENGNYSDWTKVVGTGPFELTEYIDGSSVTFTKNPDYWGFDEKYPENRLPYVDKMRGLLMADPATRMAALRSGKVDILQSNGAGFTSVDQADSLKRTNPEILQYAHYSRSDSGVGLHVGKPPFDDIRVRKAMQLALDLEGVNEV